jgi:hypothetical protein
MRAVVAGLALLVACSHQPEQCVVRDVRVESVSCGGRNYRAVSVERCCGDTCITGGVGDGWEVAGPMPVTPYTLVDGGNYVAPTLTDGVPACDGGNWPCLNLYAQPGQPL